MLTAEQAKTEFKKHGGILRTREILAAGVHPRTLYSLVNSGQLEQMSRGLYRLTKSPALKDPDLVTVAKRIPNGVVCLISALAIHELTTQIPHAVHLALPRTARSPILGHPPLQVYHLSKSVFEMGIETKDYGGIPVRVYCAEKTLADCFKHRNKIGLDVFLEALRNYTKRRGARLQKVLEYARVCRVDKLIRPYLEALA